MYITNIILRRSGGRYCLLQRTVIYINHFHKDQNCFVGIRMFYSVIYNEKYYTLRATSYIIFEQLKLYA